jgi:hypothetical protein
MLDHKEIQDDLEKRLGKMGYYHASCTEFSVQGIHGEMDDYGVKLRERRIVVLEVKGKDTYKNRETAYHQLRKDALLINRLFFDFFPIEIAYFYAHSSKNMKRGYDVERIILK